MNFNLFTSKFKLLLISQFILNTVNYGILLDSTCIFVQNFKFGTYGNLCNRDLNRAMQNKTLVKMNACQTLSKVSHRMADNYSV